MHPSTFAVLLGGLVLAAPLAAADIPTAAAVIDQFEANGGVHPGLRRNHAKGVCATGYFEGSGALTRLSTAEVFRQGLRTPVVARFSLPGPNPDAKDKGTPARGLGLAFALADGEQWRSALLNAPAFSAATPARFFAGLAGETVVDSAPPNAFAAWAKATTPSASYATETYGSLVSFLLAGPDGERQAVRFQYVPEGANSSPAGASLADDLAARLRQGPLRWRLEVILAETGDPVNDATRVWPQDRQRIVAGELTLAATGEGCRDIAFDPLLLPRGIEPSNDPLLIFRSTAYQESFRRRIGETR